MITPKFLQELISSPEYGDKNSETYKRTTRYMNILYPGTVAFDATGRMMRPEYDMTLQQFYKARDEIYADFESVKTKAETEVLDAYGDYFETIGFEFNIEEYVVHGAPIPVKVLMPGGYVSKRNLETFDLNIPEFKTRQRYGVGTVNMAKIPVMNVRGTMVRSMKPKKIYQHVPFIQTVAVGLKK